MKVALLTGTCLFAISTWWYTSAGSPDSAGKVTAQDEPPTVQPAQVQKRPKKLLSEFMRKKLNSSNRILEGLVTDDLQMVAEACDEMLELSSADRWRASNDMMYLQHSEEFRNSVKNLRSKANGQSIDGTALAWVDVTMNCIQCHEWVRNVLIADVDPLSELTQPIPGD